MASPTWQASGAHSSGTSAAPTSTAPVTTTTGRLILWCVYQSGITAVHTPPTGFTKRLEVGIATYKITIATKTGVSGDSGAAMLGSSTGSGGWGCRTHVYDNYDTAFAGTWAQSSVNGTMSTTALVASSVTTNVNDATIFGVFVSSALGTFTPDALMTERSDANGGSGSWQHVDEARPTAGATGTRTTTAATATSIWTAVLLQLPGTAAATTTLTQSTFRGRNDDGTETTATWKATAGTDWTQSVDTNFRVRFNISDSVAAATQNTAFVLRYSLNGGAYTAVSGASSVVRATASANIADGVATTEQLAGAGTFNSGTIDEVDGSALGFTAATSTGQDTEVEYSVQIRSVDVVNGDTINLRVYNGTTALDAYTDTPIITVSEPAAAASLVFDKSIRTTSLLRR